MEVGGSLLRKDHVGDLCSANLSRFYLVEF
jgi:hypothetical protein